MLRAKFESSHLLGPTYAIFADWGGLDLWEFIFRMTFFNEVTFMKLDKLQTCSKEKWILGLPGCHTSLPISKSYGAFLLL